MNILILIFLTLNGFIQKALVLNNFKASEKKKTKFQIKNIFNKSTFAEIN